MGHVCPTSAAVSVSIGSIASVRLLQIKDSQFALYGEAVSFSFGVKIEADG
jgi:hypothetical protein